MSITRPSYIFLTRTSIEAVAFTLASELYPDYPDPMPAFQYLGGEHGRSLLESALAEPQQTYGGRYLHRTIFEKAAALFRSLIKNHPLQDGNKRLALTATAQFLTLNGYAFFVPQKEAVEFALAVASDSASSEIKQLAAWLRRHCVNVRTLSSSRIGTMPAGQLDSSLLTIQQSTQYLKRWTVILNEVLNQTE